MKRPLIIGATILAVFGVMSAAFVLSQSRGAAASPAMFSLAGSYTFPSGAKQLSQHNTSSQLTVSVVLRPNNEAQLDSLLNSVYDPTSAQYQQWLAQGEFEAMFAPTSAQRAQVQQFLQQAHLTVVDSSSPFMVNAVGTTAAIQAAFGTHISDYRARDGQAFFQNDSAVQLPSTLGSLVSGVMGLSNTARMHNNYITTRQAAQKAGKAVPQYGGGPGGSGLTPSQLAGIYDANGAYAAGDKGMGAGKTLAVFELSGYTKSDIKTYEHQFFGNSENVPITDINVDGGPVTPKCPKGDFCGAFVSPPTASCPPVPGAPDFGYCNSADYSGDIEVEADIETQIAVAPKIDRVLVYNAPNDFEGITTVDEYLRIAHDDNADSISTSWGLCEQDAGLAEIQAESIAFRQMALQGQSMFDASGDTGAYDCLFSDGTTGLTVDDPTSQPYVTSVGGTSFESFDPGKNKNPSYPNGAETVWNVLDLCSGTDSGLDGCANYGAGGGGVSNVWSRPSYQTGPGVQSSYSQVGPYCTLAKNGQRCREVPDVSANADEYTPYAEYCTGNPATNSECASFSADQTPPGWFGIGGTSLSSPFWSGIIALWDSYHHGRFGTANIQLYNLFNSSNTYSKYFHDITGKNQTENNNGFYPTTPNYDMATGIGTPRITGIVKSNP